MGPNRVNHGGLVEGESQNQPRAGYGPGVPRVTRVPGRPWVEVLGHCWAGFLGSLGIGWLALAEHATQSLRSLFEGLGQSCGSGGVCGTLGCGCHFLQNLGTTGGRTERQTGRASLTPAGNSPMPAPSSPPHLEAPSFSPWSWADQVRVHTGKGGGPWRAVRMGRFSWWVSGAFCSPSDPHGLYPGS